MLEKIIKIANDHQTLNCIIVRCDIQFNYKTNEYSARVTYSDGTIMDIGDAVPGVEIIERG